MSPLLGSWNGFMESALYASSLKNILYVDAYDSFSYNVVAMLEETLCVRVTVMTIDSEWPNGNINEFLRHFEAIVLGPGPGNPSLPKDVGIMKDIWNLRDAELLPVFGICLGFQSLCLQHGIPVERLPYPLHGQVRQVSTSARDIFENLPAIEVTLYHSLFANVNAIRHREPLLVDLDFLAWLPIETDSGLDMQILMAARHQKKPFWGVQFHPESCKSEKFSCQILLQNWWRVALAFNKDSGRKEHGSLPQTTICPYDDVEIFPDLAYDMLSWSSSTSTHSEYRSLKRDNLTAEIICEAFNRPGAPTVVFQSNGRYSIISVPSPGSWRLEYSVECHKLTLDRLNADYNTLEKHVSVGQLWDALRYLMDMKKVYSGSAHSPFWGGFLGYFSYELGLSGLPHSRGSAQPPANHSIGNSSNPSVKDPPDVSLLWSERSIIIDSEAGSVFVQSTCETDNAPAGWLDDSLHVLQALSGSAEIDQTANIKSLNSILCQGVIAFPDEADYKLRIETCKAQLEAGESYELCLTAETSITLPHPASEIDRALFPWRLYKRLNKFNPAAFGGFANLGQTKIVSSSPECFLNWDRESTLEMKPMKGTVRKSPEMTMEKAKEILSSTKEMSENLMIADLIRHDLYGICGSGGVHVEKLLEVADYGRVYSMITHIKGKIRPNNPGYSVRHTPQSKSSSMAVHGLTTLQRCLPPGSMTGAPKERSCMHLHEIERRNRGIYSGVMGYLDLGGGGSFSVLIRMAFTCSPAEEDSQQIWRIGAGGAITTLSTAEGEWQEMLTKLGTVGDIFAPLDARE
ncbi:hypothetical protein N7495_002978 [Penicillium taxi]|uniref:uncharacterized protein n=1 Tax=Penicillium taxi TaxID=168475 RepID=UPI00254577B9|nr:uncharacterized protein N7495_002978 [Penicillium taxi]KAJ5902450.1 hypothetical protein N7495_002978 [Penicillium taxi]